MAANFWESTQRRHWQFSREELDSIRQTLAVKEAELIQHFPLPDLRLLSIFLNQQLSKLGKRTGVRQQPLATAQVYMRRFYSKVEIRKTNPYLVVATALYLACKMEECPQHIRVVVSEARQLWPDYVGSSDVARLGECEFHLISVMQSRMIVHHPYRALGELGPTMGLEQDDISYAWSVINDHYLTDLPLLYPPHIVAVAAIMLAVTLKPTASGAQASANLVAAHKARLNSATIPCTDPDPAVQKDQAKVQRVMVWMAESNVDLKAVMESTQELISLYTVWEQWNEKLCKEQVARFIRARGLEK